MVRLSAFCLLFLTLIAATTSEELKRLRLTKRIANIPRNLDTQEALKSVFSASSDFFAVDVDFGQVYATQEGWDNTTIPTMSIIISSNETVFGSSCFNFNSYNCKDPLCNQVENSTTSIQLPMIGVNATQLSFNNTNTPVSIINGSWQLNNAPLYIIDCQEASDLDVTYPTSDITYGWIGLGTEGNGTDNFLTSGNPTFSIHLNASKTTGELIFGFDTDRTTDSATPIMTLSSDGQWRMQVPSISYGTYNYTSSSAMTAVFDLQYEGIAVPEDLYTYLTTQWGKLVNMTNCDISSCQYNGRNLSAISDLIFTFAGGVDLTIPASYYWRSEEEDYDQSQDDYDNTWYLQMESINTNTSGSNYTVLGWRVMSQFYSVFAKTATGNTVALYNPVPEYPGAIYTPVTPPTNNTPVNPDPVPTNPNNTSGNPEGPSSSKVDYVPYYIGGAVGIVVVVTLIVFFCCRETSKDKSPSKKRQLTVELRETDGGRTTSIRL